MIDQPKTEIPVDFWCSELAQAANEPAAGTAVLAHTWIALEVPGGWMPQAFEDSDFQPDIKAHFEAALSRLAGGRIQFIKQSDSRDRDNRSLFIARSAGEQSLLHRIELGALEEILELPFTEDWLESLPVLDERLYLVCTHGTRDRCCARSGMAVFNALNEYRAGNVWQTSHLGGHRFAANLACLPEGVLYGYVSPDNVLALIESHEAGRVDASLLRGRSSYSKPAQAAEGYVWQELGEHLHSPIRLQSEGPAGGDPAGYHVVFALDDGRQAAITVYETEPRYENYLSCGVAKTKPVTHYRLADLHISD